MDSRPKILLLDDDADLLEMYQEILSQLPSRPDVKTASSGARAMAMLESEPFRLMISDLKMPKMDGLQVLSIVRRKYPELRTVVLTSVPDEQFRSRVYALGVDLYWQKPASESEIRLFLDCLESLLGRDTLPGFRGLQSKSLVDIIQLECISHNSTVLRITNGPLNGRIWINSGEPTDAESDGVRGEEAFLKVLSWRTGSFETQPAEPDRERTIHKSYNALLLETMQTIDERNDANLLNAENPRAGSKEQGPLGEMMRIEGAEFTLVSRAADKFESRGLENPERLAAWTRKRIENFRALGEQLRAGPLEQFEALGPQRHVSGAQAGGCALCLGWHHTLTAAEVHERTKKAIATWVS